MYTLSSLCVSKLCDFIIFLLPSLSLSLSPSVTFAFSSLVLSRSLTVALRLIDPLCEVVGGGGVEGGRVEERGGAESRG